MIGFNHALTGALIGTVLPWPIALPLALASHFVLDMLPHYGIPADKRDSSWFWKIFSAIDFFASVGLAIWAVASQQYVLYICGLAAVLPDFVWVAHVIRKRSFNFSKVKGRFEQWHIRIQRYEFPAGLWIELPLAVWLFYIVVSRTT